RSRGVFDEEALVERALVVELLDSGDGCEGSVRRRRRDGGAENDALSSVGTGGAPGERRGVDTLAVDRDLRAFGRPRLAAYRDLPRRRGTVASEVLRRGELDGGSFGVEGDRDARRGALAERVRRDDVDGLRGGGRQRDVRGTEGPGIRIDDRVDG